jgi:hypothetical protein
MVGTDVRLPLPTARFTSAAHCRTERGTVMMNDYAWTTLHAHRDSELRTRALHRGGDDTPTAGTRSAPARRLRLWVRRHVVAAGREPTVAGTSPKAPTAAAPSPVPALGTARRRTASDAPTAAAVAWERLASGAGSLAPATRSTTERGREAA